MMIPFVLSFAVACAGAPSFPKYGSKFNMTETAYTNGKLLTTRHLLWDSSPTMTRTSYYNVDNNKFELQLNRCDLATPTYWDIKGDVGADPSTFTCTKITKPELMNCPTGNQWRPYWVPPFAGSNVTWTGSDQIDGVQCNRFEFTEPMGHVIFWGTPTEPCRSNISSGTSKVYLPYIGTAPPIAAFAPPAWLSKVTCKIYSAATAELPRPVDSSSSL
jgi:hypothetical protein